MNDVLIVIAAIISAIGFLLLVLRFFGWLAHRERKSAGYNSKNRCLSMSAGGYIAGGYGESSGGDCGGGGD